MTVAAPIAAPRFIVDQIFPTNQIHIIFGPARSGKTTLMLQIMDDWSHGRPVFGHASYPSPHCWVSCERNTDSLRTHMRRIGISPESTPHFALLDEERHENQTIDAAIAIARRGVPKLSVMFIDGLHALCPGKINDNKDVTSFMIHVHQLIREYRLTVIGTVVSPKSRPDDAATPPGERFVGSGSWASTTDCKTLIEPVESSNIRNPERRVFLMPSHIPPSIDKWKFNDSGLLEFIGGDEEGTEALDRWLVQADEEAIITTQTVMIVAKALGISKATAHRWINEQLTMGTLFRVDRGEYRKSALNNN